MSTTALIKSATSFDDLSTNKSVQILETIKNVDAREEVATQIKEGQRQDKAEDTTDNISIRE